MESMFQERKSEYHVAKSLCVCMCAHVHTRMCVYVCMCVCLGVVMKDWR